MVFVAAAAVAAASLQHCSSNSCKYEKKQNMSFFTSFEKNIRYGQILISNLILQVFDKEINKKIAKNKT